MQRSIWRSPLVLMTLAAGLVGVVLVAAFATGMIGGYKGTKNNVLVPAYLTATDLASGRTLGKADAPVTLDIWSDFQCPACGSFTRTVEPDVVKNLVETGKLKIVYHDFLIIDAHASDGVGHESHDAATAARCAADQNLFWPYHDYLFANQGLTENGNAFKRTKLDDMAVAAGLDQAKFDACYDAGQTRKDAVAESAQAEKLQNVDTSGAQQPGLGHTPTLLIAGREINPTYDAIAAAVTGAANASPGASAAVSPSASVSAAP